MIFPTPHIELIRQGCPAQGRRCPMTTPYLSSEEMLCRLQMMAVETHGLMARSLQRTAKWAKADQERYPRADFNAASNAEMVTRYSKDSAALMEVIALLEVLSHPRFERIDHVWEACQPKYFRVGWLEDLGLCCCSVGDTVLEALLAAHKALKEKGAETGD